MYVNGSQTPVVLYWKILFRIKRISIEVWWEQTLTLQRMVAKTWQWIEFQEESEIFFLPQWIGRPSPELKTWREACAVVLRLVLVKGGNCHIWSLTIVGCLTKSQHLISLSNVSKYFARHQQGHHLHLLLADLFQLEVVEHSIAFSQIITQLFPLWYLIWKSYAIFYILKNADHKVSKSS